MRTGMHIPINVRIVTIDIFKESQKSLICSHLLKSVVKLVRLEKCFSVKKTLEALIYFLCLSFLPGGGTPKCMNSIVAR